MGTLASFGDDDGTFAQVVKESAKRVLFVTGLLSEAVMLGLVARQARLSISPAGYHEFAGLRVSGFTLEEKRIRVALLMANLCDHTEVNPIAKILVGVQCGDAMRWVQNRQAEGQQGGQS